ncbi:MAG TPA: redox-regulated ATPase YchF [Halanaerobiales bacterium]|nr:redox-regulated ATPase YchF [Halanaerobiales bacterium]
MKIGIVGLPNVGKSTLFNALTRGGAPAENYPFCTIDPNVGVVTVPDERLDVLFEMFKPEKKTPTTIQFLDIAGLVKGASRGEGLGNQFLAHIREVEAIAQVVRCFSDGEVSHVDGNVDPLRDIEVINTELIMADLETVEKRIEKTKKMTKSGEKKYLEELTELEKIKTGLEEGKKAIQLEPGEKGRELIQELFLLTSKPTIYIVNIDEEEVSKADSEQLKRVKEYAEKEGSEVVKISARIEADLAELEDDEAVLFRQEMGLEVSGLEQIIKSSYQLLELISFFTTTGNKEVRAWTVSRGATAPEAAGRVHTDMQRGFIRAEVIAYNELVKAGSLSKAREEGLLRVEGKDYIVQDGDICYFRFNV